MKEGGPCYLEGLSDGEDGLVVVELLDEACHTARVEALGGGRVAVERDLR